MSAAAVMASTASINSLNASKKRQEEKQIYENYLHECKKLDTSFDSTKATVEQKLGYAACINTLYKQEHEADVGSRVVVFLFLLAIFGTVGVMLYKTKTKHYEYEIEEWVLFPMFFIGVVFIVIMIVCAINYVIVG